MRSAGMGVFIVGVFVGWSGGMSHANGFDLEGWIMGSRTFNNDNK